MFGMFSTFSQRHISFLIDLFENTYDFTRHTVCLLILILNPLEQDDIDFYLNIYKILFLSVSIIMYIV